MSLSKACLEATVKLSEVACDRTLVLAIHLMTIALHAKQCSRRFFI